MSWHLQTFKLNLTYTVVKAGQRAAFGRPRPADQHVTAGRQHRHWRIRRRWDQTVRVQQCDLLRESDGRG
jgi:hypothetical protein